MTGTTYTDYPPKAGSSNVYYYWVKSADAYDESDFSTVASGNRTAPEHCPSVSITDLGDYLSATVGPQHNEAGADGSDGNHVRAAKDLIGIKVVRDGALTFADDLVPPLLVAELWGEL